MKIALVHDWLTGLRGGERCLQAFLALYPEADIFSLIHVPGTTTTQIDERVKGTSFLQRFPGVRKYYRTLLPLFPSAAKSLDLSGYDLVISISHAAAKNVRVSPGTTHICYCLTPMRYAWDQARTYFGAATPLLYPILSHLRQWDRAESSSVTHFVAISKFVAARIRCFYGRDSTVIYPPIEPFWFADALPAGKGEAFLYAGALVPYKGVEQAVEVCSEQELPLWVVGSGPMEKSLRRRAGKSVKFMGRVSDKALRDFYRRCRALLFPAREDFGMIPIECMASGRPVIAPYSGAAKETILGMPAGGDAQPAGSFETGSGTLAARDKTGVLFRTGGNRCSTPAALGLGISTFLELEQDFDPAVCRRWASKFLLRRFYQEWAQLREIQAIEGTPQDSPRTAEVVT